MAEQFADVVDAETGDLTQWSGTSQEGSNSITATQDSLRTHDDYVFRHQFDAATAANDACAGYRSGMTGATRTYRARFAWPDGSYPYVTEGTLQRHTIMVLADSGFGLEAYVEFRASSSRIEIYQLVYDQDGAGSFASLSAPSLEIFVDEWHTIEMRWTASSGAADGYCEWFIDGVSQGSVSNHTNTAQIAVGFGGPVFGDVPQDGEYILSDDHVFETSGIGLWSGNMAGESDSYTLSGQAAGTLYDRLVAAAAGTYSVSGQTAGLLRDALVTAGAGDYSVSGDAASLLRDAVLAAAGGSYAQAGDAASLGRQITLVAGASSYTLSGQAAGTLYDRLAAAAAGTYSLSGVEVSLAYSGASVEPPETASEHVTFVTTSESFVSTVITESSFDSTVTAESNHLSEV